MGRMGTSALRNIRALVARDLLDAVRNPTTLMSCAAGALIAAFFGRVVAGAPRLSAAEGDAFALVAALCIAPAFAGCVVELYVMAEERERGAYVTLAEAGVAPGEIAASKCESAPVSLTHRVPFRHDCRDGERSQGWGIRHRSTRRSSSSRR